MANSNQASSRFTASLKDHFIQAVLIFASVLLAFWLTDRWHHQQEDRQAADVLSSVIEEMTRNKEIMKEWTPYHKLILEGLEEIISEGPQSVQSFNINHLTEDRGIFREILTHDSWDFLRQTNPRISIEMRLMINRAFRQQEFVDRAIHNAVDFLSSRQILDDSLAYENYILFYGLISDLYYQQHFMIKTLQSTLEKLDQ